MIMMEKMVQKEGVSTSFILFLIFIKLKQSFCPWFYFYVAFVQQKRRCRRGRLKIEGQGREDVWILSCSNGPNTLYEYEYGLWGMISH